MAAAEARNPRRNIPKAIKRVYFRILVLYIGSVFVIGLLVPSDDSSLKSTSDNVPTSPFVTAFTKTGIKNLPSVRYGPELQVSFEALTLLIDHQCCHSDLCVVCWFRRPLPRIT
jgi:amino acid transporter